MFERLFVNNFNFNDLDNLNLFDILYNSNLN